MKSNGWSPTTAALQLFAHLDGEALNVALLMPVEEREQWRPLQGVFRIILTPTVDWRWSDGDSRERVAVREWIRLLLPRSWKHGRAHP